jgi:hypothetical protein
MNVVEQEMQVLKAQIQTLLLEIQEQLLNNTYPTLRAQEPSRAQQAQPPQPPPPEPTPVKRVPLEQLEPDLFDDEETLELPRQQQQRVRQQAQQTRAQQQPQPPQPRQNGRRQIDMDDYSDEEAEQQRGEYLTPQTDVRAWIEIDKWVSEKVREIGIKRTRELINLYGGQERELLMAFLNVYEEETAPPPPSPARSLFPQAEQGARSNVLPTSRDQWQKAQPQQTAASRAKNATYTPFNEHQEMVLRLIADMVANNPDMPRAANGNGHNGAKH